jgi:hypothetical protein
MRSMPFRRLLAVTVAAVALGWAPVPVADPVEPAAAHTCSRGSIHAVLPTGHKCLRRGQYCAIRFASAYRRYGFVCKGDPARLRGFVLPPLKPAGRPA